MGLGLGMSRSTYDGPCRTCQDVAAVAKKIARSPVRRPERVGTTFSVTNFEITRRQHLHRNGLRYVLVMVRYPDCTNYEGNKILLFENCTEEDLLAQGSLDPHFSENPNYHTPVARFKPTDEWWEAALDIMEAMVT